MQSFACKSAFSVLAFCLAIPAVAQTAPVIIDSRATLATPLGSPASWFPAEAYPAEAKAKGMQGRTAFTVDLDAKGRITSCNITQSSGFPLLDSTTCNLLVTNARFNPAHNAGGQAVAGSWSSSMVWQLSAPEAPPPDTINDFGGISPAEAYNQSLTDAKHAAEAASDPDQGKDGGGGPQ